MRSILVALICLLFPISIFAQSPRITDPKEVRRIEKRIKRNRHPMLGGGAYIWSWKSKIEIDSLDFINPQSHLLTKSDEVYSIFGGDVYRFNYIRIDSIDSHLVIFKNRCDEELEKFLTDTTLSKGSGDIYGYIIDGYPTLVFGNRAHKFFKKTRRIEMSTPFSKRVDSETSFPVDYINHFFIVKNDSLQKITTDGDRSYYNMNQQVYYQYVRRYLPIAEKENINPSGTQ